jgi:hypothetical protein
MTSAKLADITYESPDLKRTWVLVLETVIGLACAACYFGLFITGRYTGALCFVGLLVLNQLRDIHAEIEASRRLAEIEFSMSARRATKAA